MDRLRREEGYGGFSTVSLYHADAKYEKKCVLARVSLNDRDTFLVVLDHPGLLLTNNAAERALRHWVIARRNGYGYG